MPKLAPAAAVARSALFTYLTPRLAQDAALNYTALVSGVTSKNYRTKKADIVKSVRGATRGKLAQDADIMDLANLLDALSPSVEQADNEVGGAPPMATAPNSAPPPMAGGKDDENADIVAKIKAYLEEQGVPPEILQNLDAFVASENQPAPDLPHSGEPDPAPAPAPEKPAAPPQEGAPPPKKESEDEALNDTGMGATAVGGLDNDLEDFVVAVDPVNKPAIVGSGDTPTIITGDEDEDEEERKRREAEDGVIPEEQEGQVVTKTAMDAAIQAAVTKAQDAAIRNQRNIRAAERYVRPWVGDMAMDAARPADVYRAALMALGMDAAKVKAMHPDALVPVLESRPRPTSRVVRTDARIAADAAPKQSFLERFPDTAKITVQ